MNDSLRSDIDKAIASKLERDAAAQQDRDNAANAKAAKIRQFKDKVSNLIVPAWQEVADYVQSKGFEARVVVDSGEPPVVRLELGRTRSSYLMAKFEPANMMVEFVKAVTTSRGSTSGSDGAQHIDVIDSGMLQQKASRLVTESLK